MAEEIKGITASDVKMVENINKISSRPIIRHPEMEHPFDKKPHISLHDYIMAKETIKLTYRFPEMDVARQGPEMDLVFLKRELGEAQTHLQIVRKNATVKHNKFRSELDTVRQKDLELRSSFLRFNKFICENQDKRQRFAEIIKIEEEKQSVLNKDIEDGKSKMVYYKKVIETFKNAIEKYNIYKVFMKDVAANSSYEEISDVLNQYHAIMQTKEKIAECHRRQLADFEEVIEGYRTLQKDFMPIIVKYNVKMHDLRGKHSRSISAIQFWEGKISKMKEVINMSKHELSIIHALCWDMYCHLATKRGAPLQLSQSDTSAQLVFIKSAILEHRQIVLLAKILTEKESHSDIVTRGSRITENSVQSSEHRPKLFPFIVDDAEDSY